MISTRKKVLLGWMLHNFSRFFSWETHSYPMLKEWPWTSLIHQKQKDPKRRNHLYFHIDLWICIQKKGRELKASCWSVIIFVTTLNELMVQILCGNRSRGILSWLNITWLVKIKKKHLMHQNLCLQFWAATAWELIHSLVHRHLSGTNRCSA